MEKLILRNKLAIGDNLTLTTAIRELQKQYPEKYQIGILSYYPEIYENNPYITSFNKEETKDIPIIDMDYSQEFKYKKHSGKHFAQGYITCLNDRLNLDIQLTDCRPEIYLTVPEINQGISILKENNINEKFWLLSPAIKPDIPLKNYSAFRWQIFANQMKDNNIELIQTGDKHAINPKLKNVKSLVGKLNLREYFALARLSQGMVGHISLQTHLAAAFDKPCISVNGGRENINWYSYPNQQFLHSVGMLECCHLSGCWKKTITECSNYDYQNGISNCMKLIDVQQLIDIIMKYEGRY